MEHNKDIDFSKELREILKKNPNLEIITLVKSAEDSISNSFSVSVGFTEKVSVEEVLIKDGIIYIKDENYEDLYDDMVNYVFEHEFVSISEAEVVARRELEYLEESGAWDKVIIIWILT